MFTKNGTSFSLLLVTLLGCFVGSTYAGAFGYTDDISLISPSLYAMKKMISVCDSYASRYHITFNPVKSILMLIPFVFIRFF